MESYFLMDKFDIILEMLGEMQLDINTLHKDINSLKRMTKY